ncbi:MAG TPA: MFS transporter [Ktedonosporobacter sp.]|jgi:MFS family permease|nr:MFS transporter [Ktedonosporobacter sp.]
MRFLVSNAINRHIRGFNSNFWKYWLGQSISNLGNSFTLFALPLLVFKLTGSPLDLAFATVASNLPYPLFGLVLGAWVDRVRRRQLMISVDIARALIIALIPLLAVFGLLSVWWIYLVGFTVSTLSICFDAGEFAAIPSLVEQDYLVVANGRLQASYSAAAVLGPLLAGLLAALFPLPTILLFDAFSFLISAFSLALIEISFNQQESEDKQETTKLYQEVFEGLRYILSHPVLRAISVMMALINFVDITIGTQLVFFAKHQLQASDAQVGLLYSVGGIGVIVLALAADPLRKRWSFSTVALGALMADGLLTVIFAFTSWYWISLILWASISGLGILFNINTTSLRQTIVPNRLLGRVQSASAVLAWSTIPLGTFFGGLVVERIGSIAIVYGVIGLIIFLIAFSFSFTALGHAKRYLMSKGQTES